MNTIKFVPIAFLAVFALAVWASAPCLASTLDGCVYSPVSGGQDANTLHTARCYEAYAPSTTLIIPYYTSYGQQCAKVTPVSYNMFIPTKSWPEFASVSNAGSRLYGSNIASVVSCPPCGNGYVDAGESCDAGAQNGVYCTTYGCSYCSISCTTVACTAAGQRCYGDGTMHYIDSCGNWDGQQTPCSGYGCNTTVGGCCNTAPVCDGNNLVLEDACTFGFVSLWQDCLGYGCPVGNTACNPACTPNAYQQCYAGNIYWYDSCNNIGALATSCANGCTNGSPYCLDHLACWAGGLYWYDTAGNPVTVLGEQTPCPLGCNNGDLTCCTIDYGQAGACTAFNTTTGVGTDLGGVDSCGNNVMLEVCPTTVDVGRPGGLCTFDPFVSRSECIVSYNSSSCGNGFATLSDSSGSIVAFNCVCDAGHIYSCSGYRGSCSPTCAPNAVACTLALVLGITCY